MFGSCNCLCSIRFSLAFGRRILIVLVSKWCSYSWIAVMIMYKTCSDFCVIIKECLEESGSYSLGTNSYCLLMWTGSYSKIDGRFEQVFFYDNMIKFFCRITVIRLNMLYWRFTDKECLGEGFGILCDWPFCWFGLNMIKATIWSSS